MPIDERATSGHELGVAVLVMALVLLAAGLAMGFAAARRAPSEPARKRAGATILVAVGLVPVILVVALAMSSKGLGGSISSGWNSLTDPNDKTQVLNDPSRLTSVGSVRARYWDESIKIFQAHPWQGVGAGAYKTARLRYRTDNLAVQHSHGYAVQTAADLGALRPARRACCCCSPGSARRAARSAGGCRASRAATPPWRGARGLDPRVSFGPEHVAMATLATVVLVFGVHSFVDWTWYVPGTAVMALRRRGLGRRPRPAQRARAGCADARRAAGPGRPPAVARGARLRRAGARAAGRLGGAAAAALGRLRQRRRSRSRPVRRPTRRPSR